MTDNIAPLEFDPQKLEAFRQELDEKETAWHWAINVGVVAEARVRAIYAAHADAHLDHERELAWEAYVTQGKPAYDGPRYLRTRIPDEIRVQRENAMRTLPGVRKGSLTDMQLARGVYDALRRAGNPLTYVDGFFCSAGGRVPEEQLEIDIPRMLGMLPVSTGSGLSTGQLLPLLAELCGHEQMSAVRWAGEYMALV